jgi:hypothetical protein
MRSIHPHKPPHHIKESILSCRSLMLTIIFTITSWVGCQNLPCACPQLCSGFSDLAYKETKEGSPIHCKDNSTRAFLFSACSCIPFFCLQALSAITTCLSLVKVMTCLSLPALMWREWLTSGREYRKIGWRTQHKSWREIQWCQIYVTYFCGLNVYGQRIVRSKRPLLVTLEPSQPHVDKLVSKWGGTSEQKCLLVA